MKLLVLHRYSSLLLLAFQSISVYANENAEEARWVVQSASWGTLSWIEEEGQEKEEPSSVRNMVVSHASDTGRIFLYIPYNQEFHSSITLSEASLNVDQFEGARCGDDGSLDPEDPVSICVYEYYHCWSGLIYSLGWVID